LCCTISKVHRRHFLPMETMCNYYKATCITEQKAYCSAGRWGCVVFTMARGNSKYDNWQMAGVSLVLHCVKPRHF
jgi:hypothetical protein